MATVKAIVDLDVVTNNDRKSDYYGKSYARIHQKEPINLRGLCLMAASGGTPFTEDVLLGCVKLLTRVAVDQLSIGQAVKIDGLGTLRPTIENAHGGADSPSDYNVNVHVEGVHVRFIPEGDKLDRITSRAMKEKCILRKTYEVTYREVTVGGKPKKVPVYSPIVVPDDDPEP